MRQVGRRLPVPALVALLTAVCHGVAAGQGGSAPSDAIPWNAERPLTWPDFRGAVDRNAAPDTVATTASSLNWSYGYELERGGGRCVFRITNVETGALFHPRESWVRPAHRTDAVLQHEQGHFDLTEIHRLMLERAAGDLVGDERPCSRGTSPSDVEAEVTEILEPVRERIWQNLQRVQQQYDAQTRHGILAEQQRVWTERIQRALRRGRWN